VAAFGALGYFFPVFGEGNTPAAILSASVVLWSVQGLVLRGIQGATVLNAVLTVARVLPLVLFIVLVALAFQLNTFQLNFWGDAQLGSVLTQVKSTMLVTMWVLNLAAIRCLMDCGVLVIAAGGGGIPCGAQT